ncbi:MAG: pyruvate ferredoxin oxidoreductase subunit gamma [Candidatus Firestonebacteria bacterium]|nr:pyruvate ferredoxin oxidoreductase subunit gamma [Candidatus Firestonebacteria bacterium]
MIEIRLHGRGGQGVVTAAELLATAAFSDGKYTMAFPTFGSERMGAPVASFVRISDNPIRVRSQIYQPQHVIVQDPTIIGAVDVFAGLKDGGVVLVNTAKPASELKISAKANVVTIDATKLAIEILGRPIPNTIMVGAFCGITGIVSMVGIEKAIRHKFEGKGDIVEKNIKAAEQAYNMLKKK